MPHQIRFVRKKNLLNQGMDLFVASCNRRENSLWPDLLADRNHAWLFRHWSFRKEA
jgi:hypothetical protein